MTRNQLRRAGCFIALTSLLATSAFAAVSKEHQEWRKGPVSFIFTSAEEREWKNVKTDGEATAFIDLFWARRDPTPGTPQNEYWEEHEQRVAFADKQFDEKGRRGSMTERGRVLVVIGAPPDMSLAVGHNANITGGDNTLTGNHDLGRKDAWVWNRQAAAKFGMPKVEVVFITDPVTRRVSRDPGRSDYPAAAQAAMKSSLVSPELKTLPEWALKGGLNPQIPAAMMARAIATETSMSSPPVVAIAPDLGTREPGAAPVTTPEYAMMKASASRLTLLQDVFSIVTETSTDPFTGLKPRSSFKAEEDLGWVAQFCSPVPEVPTLRFTLRLTGKTTGGQSVNRAADPDELMPDKLKAVPGCYMLRGVVPLSGMDEGAYQLQVQIDDPATTKSYTVQQTFAID